MVTNVQMCDTVCRFLLFLSLAFFFQFGCDVEFLGQNLRRIENA